MPFISGRFPTCIAAHSAAPPEMPAPEPQPEPVAEVPPRQPRLELRLVVDPELALRATTRRFTERVELAADLAGGAGVDWKSLELDEQDAYYERAKEELA